MADGGYIKLHRKIKKWEWYDDPNTFRVFLHLLLSANHEDGRWQGVEVKRGQVVTSLAHLSRETSLSLRSVRTAINHLISTCELTTESTHRFTLVTVLKWDVYQLGGCESDTPNDTPSDKRPTRSRHSPDTLPTTNKKDKKEEKEEKEKKEGAQLAPLAAAFVGFKEMREKSRKKLTANAEEMIHRKLEELAPGNEDKQAAILNQSTMNGWAGVFPLREDAKATDPARKRPSNVANFTQREYSDEYLGSLYEDVSQMLTPEQRAAVKAEMEEIKAKQADEELPPLEDT